MVNSIVDYIEKQKTENSIVNELVTKADYLMFVRSEMIADLKDLDSKIDDIVKEMQEAGIDVEIEDIYG